MYTLNPNLAYRIIQNSDNSIKPNTNSHSYAKKTHLDSYSYNFIYIFFCGFSLNFFGYFLEQACR